MEGKNGKKRTESEAMKAKLSSGKRLARWGENRWRLGELDSWITRSQALEGYSQLGAPGAPDLRCNNFHLIFITFSSLSWQPFLLLFLQDFPRLLLFA